MGFETATMPLERLRIAISECDTNHDGSARETENCADADNSDILSFEPPAVTKRQWLACPLKLSLQDGQRWLVLRPNDVV